MAGHGGTVKSKQETDQTVLTITKALNKAINRTCVEPKNGGERQKIPVLRARHVHGALSNSFRHHCFSVY